MITWIDVPETQLLAVIIVGLSMGYLAFDRLIGKPYLFVLISGLVFFSIRFIPALFALDGQPSGVIPGNGIISAAIMWVIFFACMLLGKEVSHRTFGNMGP